MSKNNKVILASVGVLIALIMAVLVLRSPPQQDAPEPPKQVEVTPQPEPTLSKQTQDDSHKKVAEIIDSASSEVVKRAPGIWGRIMDTWNWLMAFDTKHAIILIVVGLLVVGVIINGNKSKNVSKGR